MERLDPELRHVISVASRISTDLLHEGKLGGMTRDLASFLEDLNDLLVALEKKIEEQRLLHQVTTQANAGVVLDDILSHIYDSFRPLIPYDRIGLALLEENDTRLRARWCRSQTARIQLHGNYTARVKETSLGALIASGEPRILNDLVDYLAKHPQSESTRLIVAEGMRASLTCPLVVMGKTIGFLFFSSINSYSYQSVHVDTFVKISDHLSMIVEKGRLYENMQRANQRLEAEIKQRIRSESLLLTAQEELQAAYRELEKQASIDGLTGVSNRRTFNESLTREWSRSLRNHRPISLILIDVDEFKSYNDTYGHMAGDECLRTVASVLRQSVRRPSDLVARYGGEEFAVLLPETDLAGAGLLAEAMRRGVSREQITHQGSHVSDVLTISLGIASMIPAHGGDPASLIVSADRSLYNAKAAGRNCVMPCVVPSEQETAPAAV